MPSLAVAARPRFPTPFLDHVGILPVPCAKNPLASWPPLFPDARLSADLHSPTLALMPLSLSSPDGHSCPTALQRLLLSTPASRVLRNGPAPPLLICAQRRPCQPARRSSPSAPSPPNNAPPPARLAITGKPLDDLCPTKDDGSLPLTRLKEPHKPVVRHRTRTPVSTGSRPSAQHSRGPGPNLAASPHPSNILLWSSLGSSCRGARSSWWHLTTWQWMDVLQGGKGD